MARGVSRTVLVESSSTLPDSRPVLSCTASSIEEYHIDALPSVIRLVHPYTTYGGTHSFHTMGRGLNLVQPSRLNIVHLVIVRTYCRVLKAWVSRRRRLRGSYRGGKILGREGGSWLTQAFLTHGLIQEGKHGQIGVYSLYLPVASSLLAVGFLFTTVCEIFAHYVTSVHYSKLTGLR